MILYDYKMGPNPRLVRIFLAEKNIEVPKQTIDISKGEHKSPEFRAKNPMARVPMLELDNGLCIAETVAICRYFETTHPDTPLFGTSAEEQATIEMWRRRAELELFFPVGNCFRHTMPFFKGVYPQNAEWGESNRELANKRFAWFDKHLATSTYLAGDAFSIADITAFCAVEFAKACKILIQEDQPHLQRWRDSIAARPSAKA